MLRNFLTVALRSMSRQLSYSIINIVGLAIGIACSLVIFLFVYGEWSYDRGYKNSDRIYKIGISFFNMGNFANGPERLLTVLPDQFDGIESATRVRRQGDVLIEAGDHSFREPSMFYTDSNFFKVFHHDLVSGSYLKSPSDMVLTESAANKYFGTTDVLGKSLKVGSEHKEFFVTGVVKDLGFNATVKADLFVSGDQFLEGNPTWSSASFYNFVMLKENFGTADIQAALDRVMEKNVFPESGKQMGFTNLEEYKASPNSVKFHLHPLHDVYLRSKLNFELTPGGNEANIYIFSAISVFILVLAAVNFINLTTARASRRAKEVGIRKTMGTSRKRLIFQFLGESVMISTVAMILALMLSEVFLLAFTYVTGAPLLTTIWANPVTVLMFTGFSVIVGICSGLYPAFYLTAFNPVKVLKGNMTASGGSSFRNVLVVFQFAVSMILIVSAFVVQQQLHYVQTKELGFDQNNILTIDHLYLFKGKTAAETFGSELARQTGVVKSAHHQGEPGSRRWMTFSMYKTAEMPDPASFNTYMGDADYIDLLGVKLVKGRTFDKNLASDTASIVLNESAAELLGISEDPIGAVINGKEKVIGVVSDFHWESLHNSIAPLAFRLTRDYGELSFKLEPGHVKDFLAVAEKRWKQFLPNDTFTYHFVDSNFADLLKKDEVFGKAINFFTVLAIFISCLGLYGLSAFTAEQRTKEIGIRKVLGATSSQIVLMLNRKFTVLVTVAIVVSVPFATWLISQWLDQFAYKITLGAGVFAFSIVLALITAWLAVSLHSVKASWVNPSEALKYE
jgi:putative ABC transport system permease protein